MNAARITAIAVALVAVAALGWSAFQVQSEPVSPATEATLWTAGAEADVQLNASRSQHAGVQLALADTANAPISARRVPDVAFVRRALPRLREVAIVGDGVETLDASALNGLIVTW